MVQITIPILIQIISRLGDAPNAIPTAALRGAHVITGDNMPSPITPYLSL